jgi:MFS-type transporter involved in bile tolerance (Atg22 family)
MKLLSILGLSLCVAFTFTLIICALEQAFGVDKVFLYALILMPIVYVWMKCTEQKK